MLALCSALAACRAEERDAETVDLAPVVPIPDAFAPADRPGLKSVPDWRLALQKKDDPRRLKLALNAILDYGPADTGALNAAPSLLALIKETNDPEIARLAIFALGAIGPAAKPAVPKAAPGTRAAAGRNAAAGADAEAALLGILSNILEGPAKRSAACRALIQIAPASAAVRKALVVASTDRYNAVRREALDALMILAMPAAPAAMAPVPAAAANLPAPDAPDFILEPVVPPLVPQTAPSTLNTKSKPAAKPDAGEFPYAPALDILAGKALAALDAKEADAALRTLGDAGVDPLLRALERGVPAARAAAAEALGGMRRQSRRVCPALLLAARKEMDPAAHAAIVFGAANLNAREPAVLECLADMLGSKADPFASDRAKTADEFLAEAGRDALPALRKALRSTAPAARLAALTILARFALPMPDDALDRPAAPPPELSEFVADIAARAADRDERVCLLALETLNEIGPPAAGAMEAIVRAEGRGQESGIRGQESGVRGQDSGVRGQESGVKSQGVRRIAALAAINVSREIHVPAYLTPLDTLAVDQLFTVLGGAAVPERADAALALRLHPGDAAAGDMLTKLLDDPEPQVRRAAARALGAFGPRAAAAAPVLIQWLESDPKSRLAATAAFAELGEALQPEAARALAKSAAEEEWPGGPEFAGALVRALRVHAGETVPALIGYTRSGAPAARVRAGAGAGAFGRDSIGGGCGARRTFSKRRRRRSARGVRRAAADRAGEGSGCNSVSFECDSGQSFCDAAKVGGVGAGAVAAGAGRGRSRTDAGVGGRAGGRGRKCCRGGTRRADPSGRAGGPARSGPCRAQSQSAKLLAGFYARGFQGGTGAGRAAADRVRAAGRGTAGTRARD